MRETPEAEPVETFEVEPLAPPSVVDPVDEADALALSHLKLAEAVARRFYRGDGARDEDLLQVAYIGLLKAARRFDSRKGDSFVSFAVPTISGELKRHLRDHGWFIRPPRRLQELRSQLAEARARLTQELGRAPSLEELSADLGESQTDVEEAIACQQNLYPASLDVVTSGEHTLADLIPDAGRDSFEAADLQATVWTAVRSLPPREQRVVFLRFVGERTQQHIADELGITQMQVSRILAKTLLRLRDSVDPDRALSA